MKIRRLSDNQIFSVFKVIFSDDETHIWCREWYGHHIVGKDCEIVEENKDIIKWNAYDCGNSETYPKEYGKYLICRKDGKIHWETWNGMCFSYNNNVITYWADIESPYKY